MTPAARFLTSPAPLSQFLDAVSVLYRGDVLQAKALWGAWHDKAQAEMAFEELERRSLVSVDGARRLQTHDVVRSLGVGILRDPASGTRYYGSRLWSCGGSEFLDWSKVRCPRGFATILQNYREGRMESH